MNTRTFFVVALATMMVAPLATATWKSYGSAEPDTLHDNPSLMWTNAPTGSGAKVYFNAYTTSSTLLSQGVNPNVGAVGTQIEPFGQEQHWAILGIWTDCNGDGYVGALESAQREYPALLLPAGSTTCPAVSGGTPTCWTTGVSPCPSWPTTGYNNFRGWVTELIPITNDPKTIQSDRRTHYDASSAVWGDYGKPNEPADAAGGGTCAINPLPRGTLRTTGGLLTYTDCRTGVLEAVNLVVADEHRVAGQDVPGAGDPLGFRFADDDDGTSNPTLGGVGTFGDDHSDNAIVHTGDCNAQPLVDNEQLPGPLADNTGEGVRAPDAGYLNPGGNVAGTVNHTFESGPISTIQTDAEQGPESTSNCDFEDDRGQDVYLLEGDFNGVSNTNKIKADWNFAFQPHARGGAPLGVVLGASGPATGISGSSAGPANDGGFTHLSGYAGEGPPEWFGGSTLTNKPFQTLQTRGTVAEGDLSADIDRGYWLSFYAFSGPLVGAAPGGSGKYASAQCGLATTGIKNGWNCDRTEWNLNPDGSPIPDPFNSLAYPGKTYNHRDVDCYDGDTGQGVGVQPAFYGPGNCRAG